MPTIRGYTILEQIYHSSTTEVFRAIDETQQRQVIIKLPQQPYPTFEKLLQFRDRYTIAAQLHHPQIIETYSLESYQHGYALVMEDFGGISLRQWLDRMRRLTLPPAATSIAAKLQIAIAIASALAALHNHQIVHQDLNPTNILIHPDTQQVKLIDFSLATRIPAELPEIENSQILEGTLAYLAPEQTGRMQQIDYRCDLYSCGITLYELFTGVLPFDATDPIELIQAHLTQLAVRIDRIDPELPAAIADIVAKLMAKQAHDRYQSAIGLQYDLENCLQQIQIAGTISEFELARRDLGDRFAIPDRLYGREIQLQALLEAIDRGSRGHSQLVLLTGAAGSGKTALIDKISDRSTHERGYFIQGKFDQFNRNIPWSGFVCAFGDLIAQLASQNDDQRSRWQSQILAAVGANGRVLCELIPELEQLIGPQPPVPELTPLAAQNRFKLLFKRAIEVFATAAQPLTICLDDLQWADVASIELIELSIAANSYLTILGAYRDNEVSSGHPLLLTVAKLPQQQVQRIDLAPLTGDDLARLVADTLRCSLARAQPLTELVALKTQGNPFFIVQFLKVLADDREIRFDPDGDWAYDLALVGALALSDDIEEFMQAQLQQLPLATQHLLELAACIGNSFDVETLAIVSAQSAASVAADLWHAVRAGLLLPSRQIDRTLSHEFRFLHDRVQQAAYALILPDRQHQTQLQIGRLLLASTSESHQEEKLFEIVNHFNLAIAAIQEPAAVVQLAQLNLRAAQKARTANAYGSAASYARIGTELLGESGWTQQYKLMLALSETLADAALLGGDLAAVPALVQVVIDRAHTPIERVKVYETMMQFHALRQQHDRAVSCGLEILQQLGLKLAPKPDRLSLLGEFALTKIALAGKSDRQLLELSEIDDPKYLAKLRILDSIQPPAFFYSQELMAVLSLVGIRLTLRYGNTPWTAGFYATYCIAISSLGQLTQSYRFGRLALALAERFGDRSIRARVQVVVPWYCQPWQEPLRTTIPMLDASVGMAIDSGNLPYIGINAGMSVAARFYAGMPLDSLLERIEIVADLIARAQDENSQQFFDLICHTIDNLQVRSSQPTAIVGVDRHDERKLVAQWQQDDRAIILSTLYSFQTLLAYYFEDIPHALIAADAQLPYEYSIQGGYSISSIWLFDALTRLAAEPDKKSIERIEMIQAELQHRARLMPANFQHQSDLVAAERCRVAADFTKAIDLYERAIAGAKANEYLQLEALANELAAKFYLNWDKFKIAATYMQEAYYCYARWGAKAKTDDLERRYPQLLSPILASQQQELDTLSTLAMVTNALSRERSQQQSAANIDLVSVIQSAQALSSTIELDALIQQLSQIILTNSGAQTCILVLPDPLGRWQIGAISTVTTMGIETTELPQLLVSSDKYPVSLINWIENTRSTIVLDARQPIDIPDLYLLAFQPPSVMALPIVKQEKVLGVLYLEHRQTPDIFTECHQTIVSFLCSQAAIALENANLYQAAQSATTALRESEQRYQKLADNIPGVIYQFRMAADGSVNYPYVSSGCWELLHLTPAAVMADPQLAIELVHPEDLPDLQQAIAISAQQMTPILWEGRMQLSAGEIKWVRYVARPELQPDAAIVWDGLMLDITESKQVAADLSRSQRKYYNLIQSIDCVVWEYDLTTKRFSFVSDRAISLFGYPMEVWLDEDDFWQKYIHPEDRETTRDFCYDTIKNNRNGAIEYRLIAADGQIVWVYYIFTPLCDPSGKPIAVNGLLINISDRKQIETELNHTNQRLELSNIELQRATQLKDEFLAAMSHELRTPLNAILGMSEALQEEVFGTLNLRQINSISTIEKSGEHLLSLIDDLLDLSKITAGKLELQIAPVSLTELCKSSLISVKQQAIAKQIQIEMQLAVEPDRIAVDERRIRQVLINLLDNAIKFTPPGGRIELVAKVATTSGGERSPEAWLCLSVSDTGIGIASPDLVKLFQPFSQIDSSLNRKYQGTGLGLVLVKQIVELHGGYVTVESEVGKGSCFQVMLPQTCLNDVALTPAVTIDRDVTTQYDLPAPTIPTIEECLKLLGSE